MTERALAEFLSSGSPECPACGHGLAGLQTNICPECGKRLSLRLEIEGSRLGGVPVVWVLWWSLVHGIVLLGNLVWINWLMFRPGAQMSRELGQPEPSFLAFLLQFFTRPVAAIHLPDAVLAAASAAVLVHVRFNPPGRRTVCFCGFVLLATVATELLAWVV